MKSLRRTEQVLTAIGPLVDLLRQELSRAGLAEPVRRPTSVASFTRWYLEVVQALEAHVAGDIPGGPIARGEVEMMCRTAMTAANLRQAIELCVRFSASLAPRAGRPELQVRAELASFRLDSLREEGTTASSLTDITGLFAFQQLFQWLVGADLQLQQVCIGPVERGDVMPFLKLFRAPVLAGGEVYSLDFPARVLAMPVVRTAAEFPAFFALFPCDVLAQSVPDLPGQVQTLLAAAARQGQGLPTQADLAATLGYPLSTFRRQLARTGSGYRLLRENCLRESARELLADSELSVAEVALHLGFSDAAGFRRAFRQWYGTSPGTWRERESGSIQERGHYPPPTGRY